MHFRSCASRHAAGAGGKVLLTCLHSRHPQLSLQLALALCTLQANDLFAIINGVPAMVLCAYGFLTPGIPGGVCFGAGLGITLFGISYMFIHDGLVHRRFPVRMALLPC